MGKREKRRRLDTQGEKRNRVPPPSEKKAGQNRKNDPLKREEATPPLTGKYRSE